MTLAEQLIRDEGIRLFPYRDTMGKLTIGVGRNLDDVGITIAEARYLLDNDIVRAAAAVLARVPMSHRVDDIRRAVLVNMAFNMGIKGLMGFTKMLAAVEAGDWDTAAQEMRNSKWATQVGDRAERLAVQMQTGVMR